MTEHMSDATIEARLRDFLAAELRQAESDFPRLRPRSTDAPRTAVSRLPLALAVGVVAVVAIVAIWTGPLSSSPGVGGGAPTAPGTDPLGPDGIPLSIGGEPVLRGADIDARMAAVGEPSSFFAGGYLVLHSPDCTTATPVSPASPAPGAACVEDWRLDDALDATAGQGIRLETAAGAASFVRTSGAASVLRVHAATDATLLIEAVPWRQPTKGRIPDDAVPPEGGDIQMALVPDFVGVWGGPTGEIIVGYAPKDLLLNPRDEVGGTPEDPPQPLPIPVYGEDLTTLVGHSVAGKGFVPLGVDPATAPDIDGNPSAGPSIAPGPSAPAP